MYARAVLDDDALRALAGRTRLGGDIRRHAAFAQAGPRPLQCALEAFRAEGFEQVVHGMGVERTHRVLVVCGDEDDHRRLRWFDQFQHLEAIQLRHLDVEEEQVRVGFGDGLYRLEPVGAFGHDKNLRVRSQ